MDTKTIKICVLSGGGLKGLLTCQMLINFQKNVAKCPLNEYFDIIIGSSTGAIEGSLLAGGYDPVDVKNFYLQYGKSIFTPQNNWLTFWRKLTRPIYDRNRVLTPIKDNLNKKEIFKLSDIKKCEYISTAVDVFTKRNVLFSSKDPAYADADIDNIVARSFAAPYYFGLLEVPKEYKIYSDGGTGLANLPAIWGIVEALPNITINDKIELTAFGTGYYEEVITYEDAKKYNNIDQVWNVFLADGDTLSRQQARREQISLLEEMDSKLENFTFHYYDTPIPKKLDTMDGVGYMDDYIKLGDSVIFDIGK
jgi:patatin-like phospholipase/acyl hydrolase